MYYDRADNIDNMSFLRNWKHEGKIAMVAYEVTHKVRLPLDTRTYSHVGLLPKFGQE